MTGPSPHKYELEGATVYVHLAEEGSQASVTHLDVEHPELDGVVHPDESTYVGGKEDGVFIGLEEQMIDRAEDLAAELD